MAEGSHTQKDFEARAKTAVAFAAIFTAITGTSFALLIPKPVAIIAACVALASLIAAFMFNLEARNAGVRWERFERDREIARAVLIYLEDRRVLYAPYGDEEDPAWCAESAITIREHLTGILERDLGQELSADVNAIRAAAREFVAGIPPTPFQGYSIQENDDFYVSLGRLRTLVGARVAALSKQYDVEVPQTLRGIVPPADEAELPSAGHAPTN